MPALSASRAVDGEQCWDWLCSHGPGAGQPVGAAALAASCQGAEDGEAVSWMREGCARLALLLCLLHVPEAGLQSLWFQATSKPGWFAEVFVGDGSASLSLCKLLSWGTEDTADEPTCDLAVLLRV